MNSPRKTQEDRKLRTDLLPNHEEKWIDVAKRISDRIGELFLQNNRKTSQHLLGDNETPFQFLHAYIGDENTIPRNIELSDGEVKNIEDLILVYGQLQVTEQKQLDEYLRQMFQEKTPSD